MPGVDEAAILSTRNRTEVMTVTGRESESRLLEWWRRERQAPEGYIEKFAYTHRDLGSITHSLRVAAGLDSMVVGEPQILGQMKDSYALAREIKSNGTVLTRLVQNLFSCPNPLLSQYRVGRHHEPWCFRVLPVPNGHFSR